jgi:hypothetical protein
MRRIVGLFLFLCFVLCLHSQNIVKYEYWFDYNRSSLVSVESAGGDIAITPDASSLREGIHCYTFRAKDSNGKWSSPLTKYFYRVIPAQAKATLVEYEYWMDNGYASKITSANADGNIMLMLDVSKLRDGFHSFNFRMKDSNGKWSSPMAKYFYRVPNTAPANALGKYEYWIDNDFRGRISSQTSDGVINITQDVSGLREGVHCFCFRMRDIRNHWSSPFSRYFYKTVPTTGSNLVKYEYWIDRDRGTKLMSTTSDGVVALDISTSALREGFHVFNFRMQDSKGHWSAPLTKYFYRVADKIDIANKITAYEYWFNDSTANKTHVDVDPINPLVLKDLFLTINSKTKLTTINNGFVFDVDENGVATVYTKNNKLSIRFRDVKNRWSDISSSYFVDGQGTKIDAIPISTGDIMAKNPGVKSTNFYTFTADRGDRIDISMDKACTVDVYDPFGVKVINRTLDDALYPVTYNCLRNGNYYVLSYNVTDESADSVMLKFVHTKKYAVLGCNTRKVGNNCDFGLTLSGSGFSPDTKVTLKHGNSVIESDSIVDVSLSKLTAIFSLHNVAIGKYDVVTSFGQDTTVVLSNQIEAESNDTASDVAVEILGNPFFLSGSTNIYTVKVTNTSNVQLKRVAVTISLKVDNFENIPYVKFHNNVYDITQKMSSLDFNGNEELFQLVKDYMNSDNDLRMFYAMTDSMGQKYLKCDLYIPCIGPNGCYEIPFTIKKIVHDFAIEAYASVIKASDDSEFDGVKGYRVHRSRSQGCCQQIECYLNLVISFIPGIDKGDIDLDCLLESAKSFDIGIFEVLGCEVTNDNSKYDYDHAGDAYGMAKTVVYCVLNCWLNHLIEKYGEKVAQALFKKTLSKLGSYWIGVAINVAETAYDCTVGGSWAGNCGGHGTKTGKNEESLHSWDPNDKFGYTSASGSKYYNGDVKQMTYTVEFENDPEKATAAAHDVYITDTLDANVFDLSSFRVGYVTAGEKLTPVPFDTQKYSWDIDMRPRLNMITRVNVDYDQIKGIANWHFASIDPITDNPTTSALDGFLVPNDENGNGTGYVTYTINLKDGQSDGTKVKNKASIVFDYNDAIKTPTWTNTLDKVAPTSSMVTPIELNDSTIRLKWSASDNASGSWKYSLYVQQGTSSVWYNFANDVIKLDYDYRFYDDVYYSFCVVATDSAGNVEQKELTPEATFCKEANGLYYVDYGKQYLEPGDHQIKILGARGSICTIYDEMGRILKSVKVFHDYYTIPLPVSGIYIIDVKRGDKGIAHLKVFIK